MTVTAELLTCFLKAEGFKSTLNATEGVRLPYLGSELLLLAYKAEA